MNRGILAAVCVALAGCSTTGATDPDDAGQSQTGDGADAGGSSQGPVDGTGVDGGGPTSAGSTGQSGGSSGAVDDGSSTGPGSRAPIVVVTFNSGTTPGLDHDGDTSDGYTSTEADISDQYYGNGLAWQTAVDATAAWFAGIDADIVVFQELFHSPECDAIPATFHPGFVCETWSMGDPTVANVILGDGWQVACNLEKPDKCAAVHESFGTFAGCDADHCVDGLDGAQVQDCGGGSRIGRGTIDLVGGGTLTVVNVHGTSGLLPADQLCRVAQVEQVFLDLDGAPAANGTRNIVAGDLNTDPGRPLLDLSAGRWNDFVGDTQAFGYISEIGPNATPTYQGIFNIDHVISDAFTGSCWTAGITVGQPEVFESVYFDHKPLVCELTER